MSDRSLHVVPGELRPPRDPGRRHLLSIGDLDRGRRRAAARDRALLRALAGAREQEAADAARPARRQRLLRVVDAHLVVVRARRQAALRRHALDQGERLLGREGRVAEGHRADALGLRPGRDRHPPPADRRAAARRRRSPRRTWSTPATASTSIRPRRCSTSTRSREPLGRLEGVHVAIVGDVLHSRVARSLIQALRLVGASVLLVGPPPLLPHELGEVSLRHRRDPRRRRRLRPAHAARADGGGRELRPVDARVQRPLVRDARAAPPRPEGDAPGPDEPRRRDRPARRRLGLPPSSSTRCEPGSSSGWPCSTTCSRRARSRSRPSWGSHDPRRRRRHRRPRRPRRPRPRPDRGHRRRARHPHRRRHDRRSSAATSRQTGTA